MIPASTIQKVLGLLAALWGTGAAGSAAGAGASVLSSDMIPALLSLIGGSTLSLGPSWKHLVNLFRPGTFAAPAPAAAPAAATPLGDKETEVELFRCYQELVEASEKETNVDAMDHFRDGWVSLFNTSHREKIADGSGDTGPSPAQAAAIAAAAKNPKS